MVTAVFTGTFFGLVALLYYLCFLLLAALVLFIALRTSQRTSQHTGLRRTFLRLSLSLLLWQLTLFLETRTPLPAAQLWLGRLNFAAIAAAAYFALRFVQEVPAPRPGRGSRREPFWAFRSLFFWCRAEAALLTAATLLTPQIDAQETVTGGRAITTFGPLFPLYLAHALGYLMAAVVLAFWERRQAAGAHNRMVRSQLTLIGVGMLTTGGIAFITNALLPYAFTDFRFCDVGALSTFWFLLAVAYATLLRRLFELRVFLRETLVYGLLLTAVLGAYSSSVFVVTQYLTDSADKLTQFAVLFIAFSFDPLRRFLEKKADQWLFDRPDTGDHEQRGKRGDRFPLALLFPWRRS